MDTHDPEQIASFTLGLGYPPEKVVNTLQQRCKLNLIDARSIVHAVLEALPTEGGHQ